MKGKVVIVTLMLICLINIFNAYGDTWTQKADISNGRWGAGAVEVNGKIYLVGGCSDTQGNTNISDVELYDPSTDSWTINTQIPTPRNSLGVCVVNEKIYAVGGFNLGLEGGNSLPSVEMYDPDTDTWSTKTDMPTGRDNFSCCVVAGKIYVIGGFHAVGVNFDVVPTVEEYDPETDAWTTKTPMPTARWGQAVHVVNGKIYIIGGATDYPPKNDIGTVEEYDPATDTWTTKTPMPTERFLIPGGEINGKIYVFGGFTLTPAKSHMVTEIYDPFSDTWSTGTDIPEKKVKYATCVVNDMIYVIGGFPDIGNTTGSTHVFVYNPESSSIAEGDTWTQLTDIPTARFDAAVSVFDGKIYVMGGFKSYAGKQSKIEVYDPSTDTWTEKSPMPTADLQMDACLVNRKIYLFYTNASVMEYDPENETWAEKSSFPEARSQFGTCEVNGKIYVFGGWDKSAQKGFASLDEYYPETDSWAQKADMPSERDNFACCSYQGKIYALGGWEGSEVPGSVIEYDPKADDWTTKSPMPVPVYYAAASAVNGKIYVIGGFTGQQNRTDTVQEYDLATDTWSIKTPLPIQRAGMISVVVDGKIYIVNGSDTIHEENGIGHTYVYDAGPGSSTLVENSSPLDFILSQNYPNPFNPITTITYNLNKPGMVNLVIYDLLGRKVATLVDDIKAPGNHSVMWNAKGHASGVYFYRIDLGESKVLTQKMMLVK